MVGVENEINANSDFKLKLKPSLAISQVFFRLYLKYISGIFRQSFGISPAIIRQILGKSQENLRHISRIFCFINKKFIYGTI